jgi:hypothetical protein
MFKLAGCGVASLAAEEFDLVEVITNGYFIFQLINTTFMA